MNANIKPANKPDFISTDWRVITVVLWPAMAHTETKLTASRTWRLVMVAVIHGEPTKTILDPTVPDGSADHNGGRRVVKDGVHKKPRLSSCLRMR